MHAIIMSYALKILNSNNRTRAAGGFAKQIPRQLVPLRHPSDVTRLVLATSDHRHEVIKVTPPDDHLSI